MPPARKKGASNNNNKVTSVGELQLGDLVLAKVKGFPAWPAKVSRPEDWERVPDPKKYFVQFFGTQEIAFVAPVDIQVFTNESKSRLLARCKGKTVKYFAQAVKEICEVYEELQIRDDSQLVLEHDAFHSKDGQNNGSHGKSIKGVKTEKLYQSDYEVDCASVLGDTSAVADKQTAAMKDSIDQLHEMIKRRKGSDSHSLGHIPTSRAALSHLTPVKEEKTSDNETVTARGERIESSRASSSSPYSSDSHVERDSNHHGIAAKDSKSVVGASVPLKFPIGEDIKTANVNKSKGFMSVAKRKAEGVISHSNDPISGLRVGAGGKVSSGGQARRSSLDMKKFESNTQGKASKSLLKGPKVLDGAKNSPQKLVTDIDGHGDGENLRKKNGQPVVQESQSVKKAKVVDKISDTAKGTVLKNGKSELKSDLIDEEAVPPVAKRRRHAFEAVPDDERRSLVIGSLKSDLTKKRRAVRLCDDDDEEPPKTPVHGGSTKSGSKVDSSGIFPDSTKLTNENHESTNGMGQISRGFGQEGVSLKDNHRPVKSGGELSTSSPPPKLGSSIKSNMTHVPGLEASEKRLAKESKADLISPIKSPHVFGSVKKSVGQPKSIRPFNKGTNSVTQNRVQNVSSKDSILASGSQSHISALKNRQPASGERPKVLPKDHDSMLGGRVEASKDKSCPLLDSKASDSAFSMKNLIAAAQAKRRQAHLQTVPSGTEDSKLAPSVNPLDRSPSPPASQGFQSNEGNVQLDTQGGQTREPLTAPSAHVRQLDLEEPEEKGLSLGHQSAETGSTLSGGTEAAVARDAFQGMIETLSRTKESIGRATRLAIDCAKYGIAAEVVDLLVRKLENESSFHRRVDLFFLVDSITQCSHSQKGIAGASYIPIVQSALPRLLGAAAPSGSNARENRKQCLKVLRLWRDRKILPESVLRRFMDDIGSSNDDTISGFSFKRPSRAERSVDDPIREMEGMLVDEYGSNATFNLPGFLTTHGFVDDEEEDDGIPTTSFNLLEASLLDQHMNASTGPEAGKVTPTDRRHHILEDVDGELEMEDVSGNPKDGISSPYGMSKKNEREMQVDAEFDLFTSNITESPSENGSPPLPPGSPPPLPPLPSSPPPPLPPPLPMSPSPTPPPPPPSTLLPQPTLPNLLPAGAPNPGNHQPGIPLQPTVVLPPPVGVPPAQMSGNTSQQVPCFVPAGASSSRPPDYGQNDIYTVSQVGPSNQQFQQPQQFQPPQGSFMQRPFQAVTVPQHPSGHFLYNKPTVPQLVPHPHSQPPAPPPLPSHPYSASSSDGLSRFGEEQWRSTPAEYKADNQHNAWANGGRTQPCPTPSFIGKMLSLIFLFAAYFRHPERAPTDNVGYHAPPPNPSLPSGPGHVMNQMLPSRPDRSSLNCWRPM